MQQTRIVRKGESSCRLRLASQRRVKQAGQVCGPETALNSSDKEMVRGPTTVLWVETQ